MAKQKQNSNLATRRSLTSLSQNQKQSVAPAPEAQQHWSIGRWGPQTVPQIENANSFDNAVMEVIDLELEMRARLASVATVNESERMLLLRLFRSYDIYEDGLASQKTFIDVWRKLSVRMSSQQATLIFQKYGMDTQGFLPYAVFVHTFLTSPSRILGMQGLQKGAFQMEKLAYNSDFKGKIVYRMGSATCRKPVFAPSDWDPSLAIRSSEKPDVELNLEFIYGYSGKYNTTSNIFFTISGEVVYYTAGVGIVYDKHNHKQRFFTGHDDDIKCIAMHPKRRLVATGQQCGHAETTKGIPFVCIWDTKTCDQIGLLTFPPEGEPAVSSNMIAALGFSSCGKLLTVVTGDTNHTVHVFEWERGFQGRISQGRGYKGEPPQVYGTAWNPFLAERSWYQFVTFGAKHLKFWTSVNGQGSRYAANLARYGKHMSRDGGGLGIDDVTSAEFISSNRLWTGSRRGEIYEWDCGKQVCLRSYDAHDTGTPVEDPADRQLRNGGIRALCLRANGYEVLSAGADGKVKTWDISQPDDVRCSGILELPASYSTKRSPPQIRALDCRPGSDQFIAGTHRCDLWEVDETPEVLIFGHSDEVYCAAFHPLISSKVVTASFSSFIFIWNLKKRNLITKCSAGFKVRSVAFSNPDGQHLAIGGVNGKIIVLNSQSLADLIVEMQYSESSISALSYSPNGQYLAAGSHDNFVDIFNPKDKYKRIARCSGNSSYITHLTWSQDSEILMVNDGAYEILYFDSKSGAKSRINHRDTPWFDWTCVLGFPVMGIWPDGSDGTDINSLHASHSRKFVATADDYGMIKLFNFPCVIEKAPSRGYRGHSSHVTMCRFSPDDSRLITTGGIDRAIFQWKIKPAAPDPKPKPVGIKVIDVENNARKSQPPLPYPDDNYLGIHGELTEDIKTDIKNVRMVTYNIVVWTSDIRGAGTTADVMLIIHGSLGHTRSLRLEGGGDDFRRGKRDEFNFEAADVGYIEKITVGHNNAGSNPAWHLQKVVVQFRGTATTFICNDWLDAEQGEGVMRTLTQDGSGKSSSVKNLKITIVTSDLRGAGTESNVSLTLFGPSSGGQRGGGGKGPYILDNSPKNFSRNRKDEFDINVAIESIEKIIIGHDGKDSVSAWHLASITIEGNDFHATHFQYNDWLSAANNSSEITLFPSTSSGVSQANSAPVDSYRIETQTGGHRNASSDAVVYVKFFGDYVSQAYKLDNAKDNFERGKHDIFTLNMHDLGEIKEVELWHDESGPSPDWFLEDVYIQNERSRSYGYYIHNGWITGKHSTLKRAENNEKFHYTIIVETSKIRGASTDANVFIKLNGRSRKTEKLPLGAGSDSFRQGVLDTFSFDLPDLGDIESIEIGHDNFDAGKYGPAWHLKAVEIQASQSGQNFYFYSNEWYDTNKGDRLIWRKLPARRPGEMPSDDVMYDVAITTSDMRSAGTSANVFIQIFGEDGQSPEIPLDDANATFGRGSTETFSIALNVEIVGKINALSVWHDNSGSAPDWHLNCIDLVLKQKSKGSGAVAIDEKLHFLCNQWLSLTKGPQMTRVDLFPSVSADEGYSDHSYTITVHTSDIRFAGTDANVYCQLRGESISTHEILLENDADNFERNKLDRFYIKAKDVGSKWESIDIWHDNTGFGAGWHLDYIKVRDEDSNLEATFPCSSWLDASQQSGCRHTLYPTVGDETSHLYELTIKTSHERGAGTDARVSVSLIGNSGISGPHKLPENERNNFDRDKEDFFILKPGQCIDIGILTHIELSLEGGFLSPNWKLMHVIVKHIHGLSSESFMFVCDDWLNAQNGRKIKLKATDIADSVTKSVHNYSVTTYTSDVRGAGTDANVKCTIKGSLGKIDSAALENSMNNFRRGLPDTFMLMSKDIGELEELIIEHDSSGFGASWHLSEVHVRNMDTLMEAIFPCNAWLDKHQPPYMTRMTLLPISRGGKAFKTSKYRIRTYTGSMRGAGTSSNIKIKLFGLLSTSSELILDTSSWDFKRGADDVFLIETLTLGAIQSVELISDFSGISPKWFCEHVTITEIEDEIKSRTPKEQEDRKSDLAEKNTLTSYYFTFNCWLDGDNRRVKKAATRNTYDDTNNNKLYYEVTTTTSSERGSGTISEVFIILNGDCGSSGKCVLDEHADDFKVGKTTTFIVGPFLDLGDITSIVIGHDGRGRAGTSLGSSWKLDKVVVVNTVRSSVYTFILNDWINAERGLEVTLLPSVNDSDAGNVTRESGVVVDENLCEYDIAVMTGAGRGAGTSSRIKVSIYGEIGFLAENELEDEFAKFAPGCVDNFNIRGVDVGVFKKLVVSSDGSGFGADWLLQQIDVTNLKSGMKACFIYDNWLSKKDNTLTIELYPVGSDKIHGANVSESGPSLSKADNDDIAAGGKSRYRITTHTSNIYDAGTDANVFVTIEGKAIKSDGTSTEHTVSIHQELDSKGRNNFERNEIDSFILYDENDVDLRTISKVAVEIKKGMWKPFSNWHLDYIIIEKTSSPSMSVEETGEVSSLKFYCNDWLSSRAGWSKTWSSSAGNNGEGEGNGLILEADYTRQQKDGSTVSANLGLDDSFFPEVEKEQSEYILKFYTGSKGFAGTDANVVIEILNESGQIWTPMLIQKKEHFEKGRTDTFIVTRDAGFGPLQAINVFHEGGSFGAGWFLDKITITDTKHKSEHGYHPVTYVFPCNNWVANKSRTGRKTNLSNSPEEFAIFNAHMMKVGNSNTDGSGRKSDSKIALGEEQSFTYRMTIFTGRSGTDSPVNFEICHSDMAELWCPSFAQHPSQFQQESCDAITLKKESRLGSVRYLALWLNDNNQQHDWFVEKIMIEEENSSRLIEFPCNGTIDCLPHSGKKTILKPIKTDKVKLFPLSTERSPKSHSKLQRSASTSSRVVAAVADSVTSHQNVDSARSPSSLALSKFAQDQVALNKKHDSLGNPHTQQRHQHSQQRQHQSTEPIILQQIGDWQQVQQYYEKKKTVVVYYFNVKTQESKWDKEGTPFR